MEELGGVGYVGKSEKFAARIIDLVGQVPVGCRRRRVGVARMSTRRRMRDEDNNVLLHSPGSAHLQRGPTSTLLRPGPVTTSPAPKVVADLPLMPTAGAVGLPLPRRGELWTIHSPFHRGAMEMAKQKGVGRGNYHR